MKLDRKDFQILYQLDRNARKPYASIARVLDLPAHRVRYRAERLIQAGIISKTHAVINAGRLGLLEYCVLLKLHFASSQELDIMSKYFAQMPQIVWIAHFEGIYDLGFVIRCKSVMELSRIIDCTNQEFHEVIDTQTIQTVISSQYLPRNYLVGGISPSQNSEMNSEATLSSFELDEDYKTILNCLRVC